MLDERARPAVGEDEREAAGTHVHVMDPDAVDLRAEVCMRIQPPLLLAPVEPARPVAEQFLQVGQIRTLRPRLLQRRLRPRLPIRTRKSDRVASGTWTENGSIRSPSWRSFTVGRYATCTPNRRRLLGRSIDADLAFSMTMNPQSERGSQKHHDVVHAPEEAAMTEAEAVLWVVFTAH